MTGSTIVYRIRRAAAWRPGLPARGARIIAIQCPYCRRQRPIRQFRPGARGCRGCVGNG
jgi:hypothetical protein